MNAQAQFVEFRTTAHTNLDSLHAWFDSLPPAPESFMLGEWKGGCFNTGHAGESMLKQLQWCGKRFVSRTEVYPLICHDANGNRIINSALGAAQLREVVYRGICTATMVYDNQPIFDHFRIIDDATVLGVMDRKGDALPLFFFLEKC